MLVSKTLLGFNLHRFVFLGDILAGMDKPKLKPFLMRLHPDTRSLLETAASDQRRSLSSIVDQCIRDQLRPRYGQLNDRLSRLIGGK